MQMQVKTHPFYAHIHNSNLIEGYDDRAMDVQGLLAWEYLTEQSKLTHGVIKKVQKMITLTQPEMQPHWRGYYRDLSGVEVRVGGRRGTAAQDVPLAMNVWLASYVKSLSPKAAHVEFEKIHPFADGNGRTGRLLMWWSEKQRGVKPTLIKYEDRQQYYAWFHDPTDSLAYIINTLRPLRNFDL
jgi:Fic family protein